MAIYVVTGKLGGGKSLATISRINGAIAKGLRVATNLDINLSRLPACSRRTRDARLVRVPDRPSVADIAALGFGIEGVRSLAEARQAYDEDRFGLLVLDECGTWLNAREWQAEGRRELIELLLHIRKHLWDVYLIIQDISMLDKQARKALAEHVVYCRRMDRIAVPLLGTLSKVFLSKPITFPRLHVAHVKYGDQPQSLTVDKWMYRGDDLYAAYDTTQVFSEEYPHGLHSVLPPWYQHHRSFVRWNWRKYMQLSKVYLRKHSRTMLLASGVLFGAVAVGALRWQPSEVVTGTDLNGGLQAEATVFDDDGSPGFDGSAIMYSLRVSSLQDDGVFFDVRFSDGELTYTVDSLEWLGYTVERTGSCAFRISWGSASRVVNCRY